jgi:DNA-binding response OmpR family regulator
MNVLIVDPDWHFTQQAMATLERKGSVVLAQPDPAHALNQACAWRPDVVIVAAELAGSGIIEDLAALPQRPGVLLTGWMDRTDRVWRAWQRGGDELLMKPLLDPAELHPAIVAALESAATGERTATAASA